MIIMSGKSECTKAGCLLVARFLLRLGVKADEFLSLLRRRAPQLASGGFLLRVSAHVEKLRRRRSLSNCCVRYRTMELPDYDGLLQLDDAAGAQTIGLLSVQRTLRRTAQPSPLQHCPIPACKNARSASCARPPSGRTASIFATPNGSHSSSRPSLDGGYALKFRGRDEWQEKNDREYLDLMAVFLSV